MVSLGALGLLGGKCAMYSKQCGVDGVSIIEKNTNDILDALAVSSSKGWGVIQFWCKLWWHHKWVFHACGACLGTWDVGGGST